MGVREGFEELYGTVPEGVWAAPGRVNLIGEYTDFNEGFVMPFALPHTAVAAVSRSTDGVLRLHSADSLAIRLTASSLTQSNSRIRSKPPPANTTRSLGGIRHGDSSSPRH